MKIRGFLLAAAVVLLTTAQAFAAEHVVQMLNEGDEGKQVFKPAVVFAQMGDTIRFEAVGKPHDAVSFPDMVPAGGTPFKTPMNKTTAVKVDAKGVWGYYCTPHKKMGMVGLIVVGDANIKDTLISPDATPMSKKRFQMYIDDPDKYSK